MGYPQWFLDKCREMVDRQIVWTETYGFREYIKPAPPAESNGKPKKKRGRKAVAK